MKKYGIIILILSVALLLSGCDLLGYIEEIPSRTAEYHNIGKISVTVENKPINLEDVELVYKNAQGELVEKVKIKNGEFKFQKGLYGPITFCFSINHESLGDISVDFGHFNENRWHICEYDVDIQLETSEEKTVNAVMRTLYTVEDYVETVTFKKMFKHNEEIIMSTFTGT